MTSASSTPAPLHSTLHARDRGMRVCIHRGAHEIGGSCVELEADGRKLLLDLGRPLNAGRDETVPLPAVRGLTGGQDSDLLGVILSHGHLDHYGLMPQIDHDVPVFCGGATADLLREAAFFSPAGIVLRPSEVLRHRRPLTIGPFTVTALLADHSAFDAYSLVVEAGGRRLLYTGDLRAHGRKRTFAALLADPPRVDAVLMEGTRIGRPAQEDDQLTERDVERRLRELARGTDGALLVVSAAQNIDRLVSAYRAARRARRTLVVDLYTATMARATGRSTIPQPGSHDVRVYVPQRQRVLVKHSGQFERVRQLVATRIFKEELAADPGSFLLLMQASTAPELVRAGCLRDATAVWSMWSGYLDQPSGARTAERLWQEGIALHRVHASGHATVDDLRALGEALAPARVVPIHTAAAGSYDDLFSRVQRHTDGEWWEL